MSRDFIFNEKYRGESPTPKEEIRGEYTLPVEHEAFEEEDEAASVVRDEELAEPAAQDRVEQVEPVQERQFRDRSQIRVPVRYEVDYSEYNPSNSFKEAMQSSEAEKWVEAVKNELEAHEKNETWTIVLRKNNRKPIDSK